MLISAGGVWLALFMLAFVVAMIISVENDSFFLGSVGIIISAAIAQFVFGIPIITSIITNPLMVIVYLIIYGAAGAAYAGFWRLPDFIRSRKKEIDRAYETFTADAERNRRTSDLPQSDISYDTFLESSHYDKFTVSHNKDRVASWVLLWPFGILWELMHKPIRWVWNSVYYGLGEQFEKIGKAAAKKNSGR